MTDYQNALLVLIAFTFPAGLYCAVRAALAWREFGRDADRTRAAERRSVHREWHTAHGCMDSVAMLEADEATEQVWK